MTKTVYVTVLVAAALLVILFLALPRLHHPPQPLVPETATKEPAPKPPVTAPPVPARLSRPVFAVQVGAFKDRAGADALASKLSSQYQQSILVAPATVKNQTFYRVRFLAETKPDAKTLAATLRQNDNLLTWIIPLP